VDSRIVIGRDVKVSGRITLTSSEQSEIIIGDGCLIAGGASFRTSDLHSIVDAESGTRLNPARPIRVGNRVWIANDVMVLKGSTIEDGSIVGVRAVVSGKIPKNTVAAGVPARVVREGVTWSQDLV
jgi:acetyltransferase-like isoleucine patch superfamily enzyme